MKMYILTQSRCSGSCHFRVTASLVTLLLGTLLLGWVTGNVHAQTVELESIRFSGDIQARLPFDGGGLITGNDDSIYVFDPFTNTSDAFGFFGSDGLGGAGVDAYHSNLYSLDAISVINSVTIFPNDVTSTFGQKALDGRATGIPDGINVDAFSFDPVSGDIIISIDIPANIGGLFFLPDDLIRFDGTSYSLFDSLSTGLNLDAFHILSNQEILVSFDTSGILSGPFPILDDDILRWNPAANTYNIELFTASVDSSWFPADVNGLFATERPRAGQFQWAETEVEVFENAGSFLLGIERVDGAVGSVTVTFTTADGSAIGGVDYGVPVPNPGTIIFNAGQSFNQLSLSVIDDDVIEGTKDYFVDLVSASDDGTLGNPTRIRIVIRDDEDFIFADGYED